MKNDKFDYPFLFSYDETKKHYSVIEAIDIEEEIIHVQRGINCHENYIKEINDKIKNKELVVYDPSQYGIVLVDISGYSKGNTQYQAALLSLFHQYIKQNIQIYQIFSPFEIVEGFVPTGDGCYIIFNKNINDRILRLGFALISGFKTFQYQTLRQKKDLKLVSKFLTLRVSCIIGECSEFVDLSERINYFGTGMNEAARVLNYGRKEFEKK